MQLHFLKATPSYKKYTIETAPAQDFFELFLGRKLSVFLGRRAKVLFEFAGKIAFILKARKEANVAHRVKLRREQLCAATLKPLILCIDLVDRLLIATQSSSKNFKTDRSQLLINIRNLGNYASFALLILLSKVF